MRKFYFCCKNQIKNKHFLFIFFFFLVYCSKKNPIYLLIIFFSKLTFFIIIWKFHFEYFFICRYERTSFGFQHFASIIRQLPFVEILYQTKSIEYSFDLFISRPPESKNCFWKLACAFVCVCVSLLVRVCVESSDSKISKGEANWTTKFYRENQIVG